MANCKFCGQSLTCGVVLHEECMEKLITENKTLRNELCLMCGRYENSHLGACDGCRWRA